MHKRGASGNCNRRYSTFHTMFKLFPNTYIFWVIKFIVVILVVELCARFITTNHWVIDSTTKESDMYWLLWWEAHHAKNQTTNHQLDAHDPLLGWSPIKGRRRIPNGKAFVSFNADGIRGTKDYTKIKPPNTLRILVIGDSYSFGEGVNDDETYSHYIETLLPNSEVLNLSVHGYGIDQMLLRLKRDGVPYKPDIIIFAFIENDINRISLSFRDYIKPKYIFQNQRMFLSNAPIPPPEVFMQSRRLCPASFTLLRLIQDRIYYHYKHEETRLPLANAIFGESFRLSESIGSKFVLLYLPAGSDMINSQAHPLFIESLVYSFCKNHNAYCLSVRSYLSAAYKNGAQYNLYSHYEPTTNKIIATGIVDYLLSSGAIQQ